MRMKKFRVGISVKNNREAVEFYRKVFGLELTVNFLKEMRITNYLYQVG